MFFPTDLMETTGVVSVFKTNIPGHASGVCSLVQALPGIHRCTLDVEDCDKVLRIESDAACLDLVLDTVRSLGFFIEEMAD